MRITHDNPKELETPFQAPSQAPIQVPANRVLRKELHPLLPRVTAVLAAAIQVPHRHPGDHVVRNKPARLIVGFGKCTILGICFTSPNQDLAGLFTNLWLNMYHFGDLFHITKSSICWRWNIPNFWTSPNQVSVGDYIYIYVYIPNVWVMWNIGTFTKPWISP